MKFRVAVAGDLPQLLDMYRRIVADMNAHGLSFWDDFYPCAFLAEDVQRHRLYLLCDDSSEIAAAFVLCDANRGENAVAWTQTTGKAAYLERLGVDPRRRRQGVGAQMIALAKETAARQGCSSLRLFVVDENKPAIRLYEKNGFCRVEGAYDDVFDNGASLREYGYELRLLEGAAVREA